MALKEVEVVSASSITDLKNAVNQLQNDAAQAAAVANQLSRSISILEEDETSVTLFAVGQIETVAIEDDQITLGGKTIEVAKLTF